MGDRKNTHIIAFSFRQHELALVYAGRRLLVYFGDTNATHLGVLLSHGPIRQHLESIEVVQLEAQWVH